MGQVTDKLKVTFEGGLELSGRLKRAIGKVFYKTDRSVGFPLIRRAVNGHIKEYGEVIKLNIDNDRSVAELAIDLKGELETLELNVKYEVERQGSESMIIVNEAHASKQWIDALLSKYAIGRKIPIHAEFAELLEDVLS